MSKHDILNQDIRKNIDIAKHIPVIESLKKGVDDGNEITFDMRLSGKVVLISAIKELTNIYFIASYDHKLIKIGKSKNVKMRFKTLQCGSPAKLTILTYFQAHDSMEKLLHVEFDEYRKHGEWFEANDRLLDLVEISIESGLNGVIKYLVDN